ncbi:MAG TPA: nicotinate-nucleotide--dimethylbenzimidazole phosphoribosyltransferase [Jiangellaceae bacterium]|nr:nicotinate-nucleotide--dimethylbenzimidazole phosphoribosyltransferase [Jiangellaceae bacterium]
MALDLSDRAARIPLLDESVRRQARARLAGLDAARGSSGRLGDLAAWIAAAQGRCPTTALTRIRLACFAGDHGIAVAGVSAQPPTATPDRVRGLLGTGPPGILADLAATSIRVVDVAVDADSTRLPPEVEDRRIRRGSGRIDVEDALTREEAEAAFGVGTEVADDEVDRGADLLVATGLGVASSTPAATLAAVLTEKEVAAVVGWGSLVDDRDWMRKCAAVRDAARRGRRILASKGDMIDLLAAVGGADLAALTGFVSQSALRQTPLVLDGLVSTAAAAVAQRIGRRTTRWVIAGHRSADPGHAALLDALRLEPLVDYGMGRDDGMGALLAVPHLRAAAVLLAEPGAEANT